MIEICWLTTRPIAHRGLHDIKAGVPENSLSAFARTADAGYPIELDVQVSSDGEAVVFHDESLSRMTGTRSHISQTQAAKLTQLSLGRNEQRIPLLRDVLDLVNGRVPLIVELKNSHTWVGRLETETSKVLTGYNGYCVVSSLNRKTVAWCARHLPHLPRGQNLMNLRSMRFTQSKRYSSMSWGPSNLHLTQIQFIGCHISALTSPGVRYLRGQGIPVIIFKVRSQNQMNLTNSHADNVFFEGFLP